MAQEAAHHRQGGIPSSVRKSLGIHQGDRVGFIMEENKVVLLPVIKDIGAAFGLVKARRSASLEDMEKAIRNRGKS